jgi:hypothetical protein
MGCWYKPESRRPPIPADTSSLDQHQKGLAAMSSGPVRASESERAAQPASSRPAGQTTAPYAEYEPYAYERDDTRGTTGLAAWLMILGGIWSFLVGLALIVKASYFKSLASYASVSHSYPYHWNLTGWGWAILIFGVVFAAVGVCVLLGQAWARWTGVVLAVIGAIGQFMFLPFHPFWSIIIIALDVFIIWALATARTRQDV